MKSIGELDKKWLLNMYSGYITYRRKPNESDAMNYKNLIPADINSRIEMVKTCFACPEQYDMLLDGKYVGYFRLRDGIYSVQSVNDSCIVDDLLYEACPNSDGEFEDDEREFFLTMGKIAVLNHLGIVSIEQEIPTFTREGALSPNPDAPRIKFY